MTIPPTTFNPFSSAILERRAADREQVAWQAVAGADPRSRFVLACGTSHLVRTAPEARIEFLSAAHPLISESDPQNWLLLGRWQGAQCVLVETAGDAQAAPSGSRFEELRPLLHALPEAEASLLACSRALLVWRARHRHCGLCGAPTTIRSAGHALRCSSSECGAEFFPRIDPAVIVVVSDGPHVLLGRQASWPAGRYSALAGFVEPGESLEDAVIREVHEETGVCIEGCRYFASQAWPFPSSLMLGYLATARRGALQLDKELEDARWFGAAEIAAGAVRMLPPVQTIARRLIDSWYLGVTGKPLTATL